MQGRPGAYAIIALAAIITSGGGVVKCLGNVKLPAIAAGGFLVSGRGDQTDNGRADPPAAGKPYMGMRNWAVA